MTNWAQHLAEIEGAATEADLNALELKLLGRKQGALTEELKTLGAMSPEERKAKGAELNEWKKKIEDTIASRRSAFGHARDAGLSQDIVDATHSPMFHQCEGLMVDRDVSLANMKAVMTDALHALLGEGIEFRFRTGFFPFVKPGLEIDMRLKTGTTDRWLEVAGCGMVHPTVLTHGGIDPAKFQGFAFGFGIERLLMIKHGIPDLRSLYENDLRLLKQFA